MEMSGQLHASTALPPEERAPRYPLHERMGRSQTTMSAPALESNSDSRERTFPARLKLFEIKVILDYKNS
jgi:hypothetical protein